MPEERVRKTIPVVGMHCPTCTLTIEKKLKELEGVQDVRANYITNKVYLTYDPGKAVIPAAEKTIEDLGYKVAYKKYESFTEKLAKRLKGEKQ